jgi:hypothetical protein
MIDVVHTLARDDSGNIVAALLPAQVSATLTASRLELVAVNASRTVELAFAGHFVPADLVSGIMPHAQWLVRDAAGLRPNGSLSLGVAGRCGRLLEQLGGSAAQSGGAAIVRAEVATIRAGLDAAAALRSDEAALPAARAAASVLAFQAAGLLVAAAGSHSILAGEHPQRLAREALFLQVFGSRPAIKDRQLALLTPGGPAAPGPHEAGPDKAGSGN